MIRVLITIDALNDIVVLGIFNNSTFKWVKNVSIKLSLISKDKCDFGLFLVISMRGDTLDRFFNRRDLIAFL